MERKLTAILSADVQGYSRLMGEDEESTIRTLTAYRQVMAAFVYKGKPVKIAQISRELGARYVVEGSVRLAGGRVRITAQLIDAATGGHLWAGRYDREIKDLFAVQDEITQRILGELKVKLLEVERERLVRRYTSNLEAWDYFMRGWKYDERFTKEAVEQARQMWEKALALDPQVCIGVRGAGPLLLDELGQPMEPGPSVAYRLTGRNEEAIAVLKEALAHDPDLLVAHRTLAVIYSKLGRLEEARAEVAEILRINPHYTLGGMRKSIPMKDRARLERTLDLLRKAGLK